MIDKDGPIATPPSKAEIWNLLCLGLTKTRGTAIDTRLAP